MQTTQLNFTKKLLANFNNFKLISISLTFLIFAVIFPSAFNLPFNPFFQADTPLPNLIQADYKGFVIISYKNKFYGVDQTLMSELTSLNEDNFEQYQQFCSQSNLCITANSLKEVKQLVNQFVPVLIDANKGCNIFAYHNQFHVSCIAGSSVSEARQLANELVDQILFEIPLPPVKDLSARQIFEEWYRPLVVTAIDSSGDDSIGNTNLLASLATDGNTQTFWSTPIRYGPSAEYLTVDLGADYLVGRVRWLARTGHSHLAPSTFDVALSLDGVSWITVMTEQDYVVRDGVWSESSFSPQQARYVRLSSWARPYTDGSYYLQIAEFEVSQYDPPAEDTEPLITELSWTVPERDREGGAVTGYEIRWATEDITNETAWTKAMTISGPLKPREAGVRKSLIVKLDNLPDETVVHFSVRTRDRAGNLSELSNDATVRYRRND